MATCFAKHILLTHQVEPEGHPDLLRQLTTAKNALVFGPENRTPHALFFACGRQYAGRLRERLEQAVAVSHDPRAPAEILAEIAAFDKALGLRHHPVCPNCMRRVMPKRRPSARSRGPHAP